MRVTLDTNTADFVCPLLSSTDSNESAQCAHLQSKMYTIVNCCKGQKICSSNCENQAINHVYKGFGAYSLYPL
ncbi:hypothetical protein SAMN02745132_03827 [Enterovibrio nigricans DSM 22720]|uniref:Uncharacterized protein n=1 Tax=Enterovibrio nigricans DSM 22720 TaxID=1121868 RepID=A0A1T4VGK4_9GAMM|nr:hypothetical protein SAMN02745132_03827 [Enterovibrio nigricans DSM 22720]